LILLIQSIVATSAVNEFHPSYSEGLTIAVYVGMLIGALFWGLSADIIGRKFAFNASLMLSSVFCLVAGASPNWVVLGLFVSLAAFGAGGNLVLDTTVFLEYLPSKQQWLLTLMAAWWGGRNSFDCSIVWQLTYDQVSDSLLQVSLLGLFFQTTAAQQMDLAPKTTTKAGDTSGMHLGHWSS
jgi:MFS family permease